ncbi:MAG TPA: hypothetical protein VFS10_03425 [Pyrinomonadaceae bacterium]|nr:hypothetical protein [Pyrinomonadaceae bacterium]
MPGFQPSSSVVAAQALKEYTLSPNKGRPGKDYDVLVVSRSSDCGAQNELTNAYLVHPEGGSIAVVEGGQRGNGEPCVLRAKIRVPADAAFESVSLRVVAEDPATKKTSTLGIVEFSVSDTPQPGVIPPGVNPPAVDIMWSVMPKGIVGDNFGRKLKNDYYAIEVVIGNNSAYNLQIVSVGFELPTTAELQKYLDRNARNRIARRTNRRSTDAGVIQEQQQQQKAQLATRTGSLAQLAAGTATPDEDKRKTVLPSSSYRITRGSLEARQATNARTLVLSTITALGPIFTGFTPYFHNVNHRANYSEAINIFSNPLEKGLELVWPNPRDRQRERFDEQVLRDGLIIRNNTQIRTLVFFPKDLLRLPGDVETEREYQAWRNNAREVRERLGKLIIIGDVIQYANRITLVANPPGPVEPPPIASAPNPQTVPQGAKLRVRLSGTNLKDAGIAAPGEPGITVNVVDIDENGRAILADVEVEETVRPGTYTLQVSTPSGRDEVTLKVTPKEIVVKAVEYEQPAVADLPKPVTVTVKGTYLHNSRLELDSPQLEILSQEPSEDGREIRAEIRFLKGGTAGQKFDLRIVNTNIPGDEEKKEIQIAPATTP